MDNISISYRFPNGEIFNLSSFSEIVSYIMKEAEFISNMMSHGLEKNLTATNISILKEIVEYASKIDEDRGIVPSDIKSLVLNYLNISNWPHIGSVSRVQIDEISSSKYPNSLKKIDILNNFNKNFLEKKLKILKKKKNTLLSLFSIK